MKFKLYFVICFVLNLTNSYAQEYEDYDCGWYGTKTVAKRNKLFPFNEARKILLLSYLPKFYEVLKGADTTDTELTNHVIKEWDIKLEDFKVRYLIKEEIELNEAWKNQLSHVLVNYKPKKDPGESYVVTTAGCYNPRNAILFLNSNNTVICCLEICFECRGSVMEPDPNGFNKYVDIEECHPRLNELLFIFRKNGIIYGVE